MYKISLSGCRFIGDVEGCVLHPYHGDKDKAGVMTIYYGHVIRPGDGIEPPYTQAKADYWLRKDTAWVQEWIWKHCPWSTDGTPDRQHNFDACCSLVLNAGHIFSDVLEEINGQNRPDIICKLWLSHALAGGDPHALDLRRSKEVALYLTPDPPLFTEDEVREVLARVALTAVKFLDNDGLAGLR